MRSRNDLHFGKHMAQMLGVLSVAAASLHVVRDWNRQRRLLQHLADLRPPPVRKRARVNTESRLAHLTVDSVRHEQLAGVTP